jgi:hypothetical protein
VRGLTTGRLPGVTAGQQQPGQPEPPRDVGAIVARLVGGDGVTRGDPSGRSRELRSLVRALAASARMAGKISVVGGRWLTELLIDVVPRIPIRDLDALRAQHPGLSVDDLAETLISGAAKATGAVGVAGGALATIEFAAPPTLLTVPAQLAAEGLLIAAIEVKLIAELHEVYGAAVSGTPRQRALAYLVAWSNRRGINPLEPGALRFALGGPAKAALRRRLVRRAGLSLSTMGPLLTGAVAGSMINHRETRRVGNQVRSDLRGR